MSEEVIHEAQQQRFLLQVDGHDCVIDYELDGNVMTITHTGVPAAVGGRGLAGRLMQAAVGTARQEGWQVVPECSYAAAWFKRHPEQADLLAA